MADDKIIKSSVHITLGIITIILIVSGLGIAYYQTITFLTLGTLDKTYAFKIHTFIFPIFLILLVIHALMPNILNINKE